MSIGLQGQNLVFLISQPRAGSTLLQRILGSHPDIQTLSEPWLMLHPLYALRPSGYEAEYDARWAGNALHSYLQTLSGGDDEYLEGVRRMCTYLYDRALRTSGKRYFLDKTPRYYFIIPELYRVFPKAHYIILIRNPLAVLCSIIRAWTKEDWLSLYRFRHDLIRAPELLLEGIRVVGDQGTIVQYEQLVRASETEVRRICGAMRIDFVPGIIEYGHHDLPRWRYGDQEVVYQHMRPIPDTVDRWMEGLSDAQTWRLASDYLQLLGRSKVEQMGYSHEGLRDLLEAHRPHQVHLLLTLPLAWLLEKQGLERSRWIRALVRLMRSLQRRGMAGTAIAGGRRLLHVLSSAR